MSKQVILSQICCKYLAMKGHIYTNEKVLKFNFVMGLVYDKMFWELILAKLPVFPYVAYWWGDHPILCPTPSAQASKHTSNDKLKENKSILKVSYKNICFSYIKSTHWLHLRLKI